MYEVARKCIAYASRRCDSLLNYGFPLKTKIGEHNVSAKVAKPVGYENTLYLGTKNWQVMPNSTISTIGMGIRHVLSITTEINTKFIK